MTRFVFTGSLSCINSPRTVGTICQDRPNLSVSQPHWDFAPPSDSFSHNSSTSSWVLQFTTKEIAGENVNVGPPFRAMNSWPSIWNFATITAPLGPGPASP